jgi:acetyl esterase/lipase
MKRILLLGSLAMGLLARAEDIPLWPAGVIPADLAAKAPVETPEGFLKDIHVPTIAPYLATATGRTAAVVVVPGGGYSIVAVHHEGYDVAKWFNSIGVSAFVLKYRLPRPEGHVYPPDTPLQDAERAIRMVRARAAEWKVDPARIGILGFSAGGHLAATASTRFEDGQPDAADPVARVSSRPDFSILIYPVIDFSGDLTHRGSRDNLLGADPSPELVKRFCPAQNVTAKTPPAFLVHSRDDRVVPFANSELYRDALVKAGVPVELQLYNHGAHGYGLGRAGIDASAWPKACEAWLRARGILTMP